MIRDTGVVASDFALTLGALAAEDVHGSRSGNHLHRLTRSPRNVQLLTGAQLDALSFEDRDTPPLDDEDVLVEVVGMFLR